MIYLVRTFISAFLGIVSSALTVAILVTRVPDILGYSSCRWVFPRGIAHKRSPAMSSSEF